MLRSIIIFLTASSGMEQLFAATTMGGLLGGALPTACQAQMHETEPINAQLSRRIMAIAVGRSLGR